MSLAAAGRARYAAQIERDCRLGDLLRGTCASAAGRSSARRPCRSSASCRAGLPRRGGADPHRRRGQASGEAWISDAQLDGRPALRACIISHRSTEADVDALFHALERASQAA